MNMTEFEEFCKQNNCLKEANQTLVNIYQEIDEYYPSVDCNVINDFNNDIISIGHLEDMNDIHYCNSCYDNYGYCRMNRPNNTDDCTIPVINENGNVCLVELGYTNAECEKCKHNYQSYHCMGCNNYYGNIDDLESFCSYCENTPYEDGCENCVWNMEM